MKTDEEFVYYVKLVLDSEKMVLLILKVQKNVQLTIKKYLEVSIYNFLMCIFICMQILF